MARGVRVKNTTVSGGLTGHDTTVDKVFSHKVGQSHSIMKRYNAPSNPRSATQMIVRNAFREASQQWSLLTEEQRKQWNEMAKEVNSGNKEGKTISGKNLFASCNTTLSRAGLDPITNARPKVLTQLWQEVTVLPSQKRVTAILDFASSLDMNGRIIVRATKPMSAGYSIFPKPSIVQSFDTAGYDDGSPNGDFNYKAAYEDKYGAPVTGQKIYVEVAFVTADGYTFELGTGLFTQP